MPAIRHRSLQRSGRSSAHPDVDLGAIEASRAAPRASSAPSTTKEAHLAPTINRPARLGEPSITSDGTELHWARTGHPRTLCGRRVSQPLERGDARRNLPRCPTCERRRPWRQRAPVADRDERFLDGFNTLTPQSGFSPCRRRVPSRGARAPPAGNRRSEAGTGLAEKAFGLWVADPWPSENAAEGFPHVVSVSRLNLGGEPRDRAYRRYPAGGLPCPRWQQTREPRTRPSPMVLPIWLETKS